MSRAASGSSRIARRRAPCAAWLVLALATLGAARAGADPVISFNDDATVPHSLNFGMLLVSAGSLLDVGRSTIVLEETDVFDFGQEDIDAAHLRLDGKILFSTTTSATIGGTIYVPGDVVLYDPDTGVATRFFDQASFESGGNVDAVHLFEEGPNAGKLLLSTSNTASLGGLVDFGPGDLVLYDRDTDTASLFFSETLVSGTAGQKNVDAVQYRNGKLILSFLVSGGTLGGLPLEAQDLVLYDPQTDTAEPFFDGDGLWNGITANIDAVSAGFAGGVPTLEAPGLAILALALAALGIGRARKGDAGKRLRLRGHGRPRGKNTRHCR